MFDIVGRPGAPWEGASEEAWREWESGHPEALLPTMANTAPSGIFALETDLATADPTALPDAELVDAVVGLERIAAWARARQHALLAEFARRPGDGTIRKHPVPTGEIRAWAADEIGMALHLSPGAATARLADATRLDAALRPTRDLLAAGRLDESRARLIATTLSVLDDAKAAAVQARVLPHAPGQTWSQLKAALRRAVLAVDAEGAAERHRRAARERRVDVFPGDDGMATLWACIPAVDAAACFTWLTRLARGLDTSGEGCAGARGSLDARRADVAVALLTGRLQIVDPEGEPALRARPVGAERPLVQVAVPVSTLTGASEEPGELAGYGPVPAHVAREIAADPRSTWYRLLTDPASGALLDHGRTVYRPPAGLAAFVRARDGACRHPACSRTAAICELDHVAAWQHGGSTSEDNIACLCERHHDLKEQPGWQVVLHRDRSMEWITPTGHRYLSRAVDHRGPWGQAHHAAAGAVPAPPGPETAVPAPPASRSAPDPQAAPARPRWSARDAFGRGDPVLANGDPPPF